MRLALERCEFPLNPGRWFEINGHDSCGGILNTPRELREEHKSVPLSISTKG